MAILFAILLFSFLIFIHELGHFVAAKLLGVRVNEFSMFMGPAIFSWTRGETKYSIRCIPIGGYCAMEGEDGDSDDPRSFGAAKRWKRLIILVAGSFMNFLTGVVLIVIFLFNQPGYKTTQIEWIDTGSSLINTKTAEDGLMVGDKLLEIDGDAIRIYEDFGLKTMLMPDGYYDILVERGGKEVLLKDVQMEKRLLDNGIGGKSMIYGFRTTYDKTTFGNTLERALPTAGYFTDSVIVSLKMLFTGQAGIKDMTGPVGIVQVMSDVTEASDSTSTAILNLLWFAAFIAINLAVMNMLPFPALDGGRVVGLLLTAVIEGITRKKLDPKYEGIIHGVGMLILLALMAIIMFKDIFVLFKG